jgi:hypothetical protein
MSKKINNLKVLLLNLVLIPCVAMAQGTVPFWIDADVRSAQYPAETYYTGFAEVSVASGEGQEKALNRAKQRAVGELSERVRVEVSTEKKSTDVSISGSDIEEQIRSTFEAEVKTASNAEIIGAKVESYYDRGKGIVYAFAYANKHELATYYKANIAMLIQQVEGSLNTAEELEHSKEKSKARKHCEDAIPVFAKIRYAQDLLTALDAADGESLQQAKSEALRNKATQMMARLAQGLYVYVESSEDLFGKKVNIIVGKLKAILAKNGCSFTDDEEQADLKLTLTTTTRESSNLNGLVFCYADTEVDLYDNLSKKACLTMRYRKKAAAHRRNAPHAKH